MYNTRGTLEQLAILGLLELPGPQVREESEVTQEMMESQGQR